MWNIFTFTLNDGIIHIAENNVMHLNNVMCYLVPFYVLQLPSITFTQQASCRISKSMMKHTQPKNQMENRASPYLVMFIGRARLLIS